MKVTDRWAFRFGESIFQLKEKGDLSEEQSIFKNTP